MTNDPILTLKSKPPHYTNSLSNYYRFYIIMVTKGLLFFEQNRIEQKIIPGELLILRLGGNFKLRTTKQGYEGLALSVNHDFNEMHKGLSLKIVCNPQSNQLIQMAYQEITNPSFQSKELLTSLSKAISVYAFREIQLLNPKNKYDTKNTYWTNCIIQAIEGALFTDKSVEEILKPLQPSYRQLARYMKETKSESPKSYQLRRKMEEACKMIETKQLSITYIAFELGFPSAQHFSTQFKKHKGHAPKFHPITVPS